MTTSAIMKGLGVGLGLYALVCLAVVLFQRRLMYFPDRMGEAESVARGAGQGLAPWGGQAGQVIGWRRPLRPKATARVLVFHGNAGDALHRVPYLPVFEAQGLEVILFEYPGYGCRPGPISQPGIIREARQALARLRAEDSTPVLLLGESLGSGVAVQLAALEPAQVAGLLLVTPFARMTEVAALHYPWIPHRLLMRDRWDSAGALKAYRGPVAILIAGRDEVVGADQGHRLAAAVVGPVRVWKDPVAGHNSLDLRSGHGPWVEMVAFLLNPPGSGR